MQENDETSLGCAKTKQAFDDCGGGERLSMPLMEVEKTMKETDSISRHVSGRYSSACVSCFVQTNW